MKHLYGTIILLAMLMISHPVLAEERISDNSDISSEKNDSDSNADDSEESEPDCD
jgi:hypothetical protein